MIVVPFKPKPLPKEKERKRIWKKVWSDGELICTSCEDMLHGVHAVDFTNRLYPPED